MKCCRTLTMTLHTKYLFCLIPGLPLLQKHPQRPLENLCPHASRLVRPAARFLLPPLPMPLVLAASVDSPSFTLFTKQKKLEIDSPSFYLGMLVGLHQSTHLRVLDTLLSAFTV